MSENKHTPPPWTLPHFAKPDVNCACGYVLAGGRMGAVATVHCSGEGEDWRSHGDNPKYEEAVANAHLIWASPYMFDALKAVKKACPDMPRDVDQLVCDALNKAEGRS